MNFKNLLEEDIIDPYSPLTRKEERELIRKYQETKDNDILEKLIKAHLPFMVKISKE